MKAITEFDVESVAPSWLADTSRRTIYGPDITCGTPGTERRAQPMGGPAKLGRGIMAEDQYVSMGQFGEFVKRIDERFDHVNELAEQRYDSLNQRLANAEKAREQNLVHINQRFDGLEKRMDQFHADMLQMRNWLVRLYGLVVFGFLGAIALILFRDLFFK